MMVLWSYEYTTNLEHKKCQNSLCSGTSKRNIKVTYHTSKPIPQTFLMPSQLVALKWDLRYYRNHIVGTIAQMDSYILIGFLEFMKKG